MNDLKFKEYFFKIMIGALSVSALIAILIFLFGEFGETETRILMTTVTLGGFSMTGFGSALSQEKDHLKLFSKAGMIVSALGFFISILAIWEIVHLDNIWKLMFISMVLSFSIGHMSLLFRMETDDDSVQHSKTGTLICICLVGLMLIKSTLSEFNEGEFYFRLLGVFSVLDVIGTVTTLVKHKMSKERVESEIDNSTIKY